MGINHQKIQRILLQWAAEDGGQEAAALAITDAYQTLGLSEPDLNLPPMENYLRANRYKIFCRWLHADTEERRRKLKQLLPAIKLALPPMLAAQFDEQRADALRAATANKECIEATSALTLGAPLPVLKKEVKEGIWSLLALLPPGTLEIKLTELESC